MSNPDNSLSPRSPRYFSKADPDNGEFQLINDEGSFSLDEDKNDTSFNDPEKITYEDFENNYMDENKFIEL